MPVSRARENRTPGSRWRREETDASRRSRAASGASRRPYRLGSGKGCEAGLLEGDQAAGELEEGEVVLVFLRPADQQGTVAVEPGVAGLDHPAAGAPVGVAGLELDLLAARADVRREPALVGELAGAVVVVAAVETEPLRLLGRRLRALDRERVERRGEQLQVVPVGTVLRQPDRDPLRLAEKRTLRPLFALSVGLGPVLAPPSGALPIAPSQASHSQSIPTTASYSKSPCRQISWNTPACSHS